MAGYRGDGYGMYGDHGDDDFYQDMRRGRDDDRFRSRDDDERRREHGRYEEDGRRGFMLGRGDEDHSRDRFNREDDRRGGWPGRGEEQARSWMSDDDRGRQASRFNMDRGARDEHRGEGFLERAGHQVREWMDDDGRDDRSGRGSPAPMGLSDRSRVGGGLGMGSRPERGGGQRGAHDHYLSWRERQLAELDRDYDEYCRENEQKFSSEFEQWRQNRRSQPAGAGVGSSGAMAEQGPPSSSSAISPTSQQGGGTAAMGESSSTIGLGASEELTSPSQGEAAAKTGRSKR